MAVSKALAELSTRPHALYRFFDRTDVLLYVGTTAHLSARIAQHKRDKPWWVDVRNITIEYFDTRSAALSAETKAIRTEGPLYNTTHNEMVPVPGGIPEVVTWTPHGPRTVEITEEWIEANWASIPQPVRHRIEAAAYDQGCYHLASEILDCLSEEESAGVCLSARKDAADDELLPQLANNESYVASRAAVAAFASKCEDVQRLETAAERLFEKLPSAVRHAVLERARDDVEWNQGHEHTALDITCWAVYCLAYAIESGEVSLSLGKPLEPVDPWGLTPSRVSDR